MGAAGKIAINTSAFFLHKRSHHRRKDLTGKNCDPATRSAHVAWKKGGGDKSNYVVN